MQAGMPALPMPYLASQAVFGIETHRSYSACSPLNLQAFLTLFNYLAPIEAALWFVVPALHQARRQQGLAFENEA